jgi:signal transduction histidine kinase
MIELGMGYTIVLVVAIIGSTIIACVKLMSNEYLDRKLDKSETQFWREKYQKSSKEVAEISKKFRDVERNLECGRSMREDDKRTIERMLRERSKYVSAGREICLVEEQVGTCSESERSKIFERYGLDYVSE